MSMKSIFEKMAFPVIVILIVLPLDFCHDNSITQPITVQERLEELLDTYDLDFQEYLANAHQTMGKTVLTYQPVSTRTTIPKYIEIRGSHYDYGRLAGLISQQYGRQPRSVSSGNAEFNNRIIDMYRNVYPRFLEIARGVGDVFGIPVDELDFVHFEDDFFYGLWWNLLKYPQFQALMGANISADTEMEDHCALVSANLENNTI